MNPTPDKLKAALRLCAGDDCRECYFYRNKFTCQQDLARSALAYIKSLEDEVARTAAFEDMYKDARKRLNNIVYCEECVFWHDGMCENVAYVGEDGKPKSGKWPREYDDFCPDGERRNGFNEL